ncbi:transcription factor LBX2 [Sceloporus undulatus]|uniref:transcription factor LBX2 n=1 Tax=Sceloporus undulatus TaxID=8520 RepID=UPI001C4D7E83|nr:transcription factor LBX2 [Sceloporus undulatus]
MTSRAKEGKATAPPPPPSAQEGRPSPLDQLPPPAANSAKPLTPFSIADILGKPCGRRDPASAATAASAHRLLDNKGASGGTGPDRNGLPAPASPLCALEELASKTFRGLEVNVLQAAEGRDPLGAFGPRPPSKKRRKSRTAFTNHQIFELEKRFLYQKYLSPADRDHIAGQLGLSNAQVITWFQNRRAKLKRDLEEMKADVESLKKLPPAALEKLASMPDSQTPDPTPGPGTPDPRPREPFSDGEEAEEEEEEEEEEEIDVGD